MSVHSIRLFFFFGVFFFIIDLEFVSVNKNAKENLTIIAHGLINNAWYHNAFAFYVVVRLKCRKFLF